MMRITHKLVFTTACLAIFSAVVAKPASAIDNNLSEQFIAQTFSEEPFVEETPQKPDSNREIDVSDSNRQSSDDSWILPVLWGFGGYFIGSLVGTNKTYTKMNKGR
jgi:hypothetical protein